MGVEHFSHPFTGSLAEHLRQTVPGVRLYWLGQAGFVIQSGTRRIVIDAYLSDYLAQKYQGKPLPHQRMEVAPIDVPGLGKVDLVLCTHQHSDHMDPHTMAPLARSNPDVRFVVPRAALGEARQRIAVDDRRLLAMDAGERIEAAEGIWVSAARACHETLERDEQGNHRFLGYLIEVGGVRIFHSGDTIPFPGQVEEIRALRPDVALLPVNGRSPALSAQGVPGNLNLEEAVGLCQACGIQFMIAHHYGLFAFNTADPRIIDQHSREVALPTLLRAQFQMEFTFTPLSLTARQGTLDGTR